MKLSDLTEKKFIETLDVSDWLVETDTGWEEIESSNKTVKYQVYEVVLENGQILRCADTHILFDENLNEIYVKDCKNKVLYTKNGPQKVVSVNKTNTYEHMYDLSVNSENHRYYTNNILSHNSQASVIWILHFAIFNPETSIAILANKAATAREMLSRITLALENLPFFLQPGCKTLNKGSIDFSNNSKIIASSTSSSSIRGFSFSCVPDYTKVTVMMDDGKTGKIYHNSTISEILKAIVDSSPKCLKILTQDGFKNFEGFINQGMVNTLLRFSFQNNEPIDCTEDHEFLCSDGKYKKACELVKGNTLYPNKVITDIEKIDGEIEVFDALNVEDVNSYITNGIVSHNCVYLDEFAFVNRADEFYTSTYPVITSGKSTKVIITSTANGVGNLYHRLWQGAVQGTNAYIPFRVDWWDVPGRDEAWKEETIKNTSEMQFRQEMSNEFLGMGNTLISTETLLKLKSEEPISIEKDGTKIYEHPVEGHDYMMIVDVSKGRGKDYSTFTIIDISARPFKQVAVYRNNLISPLLFPDIIYKYANAFNKAWVIVESNDSGAVVCNSLYYDLEYENVFVESTIKSNAIGVFMNKKVKRIGCSNIKDLIEENKLHIVDSDTILEISTFSARGNSYEASDGNHDDLMMNLVMFGWFTGTPFFQNLTDVNIKEMIYREKILQIENDMIPFGIIDDGLSNDNDTTVIGGDVWTSYPTGIF